MRGFGTGRWKNWIGRRTPAETALTISIIPNLELAQSNIREDRVLKHLENAMRAAEGGAQLTNQLLAFSRRHEISTEAVDVNQVVSEACEMLPRTIGPTIEIETAR